MRGLYILSATFGTVVSVLAALVQHRTPWLLPVAVVLLLFATVLFATAALGPLAPFVYPLL